MAKGYEVVRLKRHGAIGLAIGKKYDAVKASSSSSTSTARAGGKSTGCRELIPRRQALAE